jgi:hypothetical protein
MIEIPSPENKARAQTLGVKLGSLGFEKFVYSRTNSLWNIPNNV